MKYIKALEMEECKHICPFCLTKPTEIIEETKHMIVTPSRAPYHHHHIMIIPRRHVVLLADLTPQEFKELFDLLQKRNSLLHTQHQDVILYLKDGYLGGPAAKTVEHFHFHLVPDCYFGAKTASLDREFMDQSSFELATSTIKKQFLK